MMRTTSDTSGSDRMSAYKRGSIRGMQGLGPGHFNQDGRASPTPSHATSIGEVSLCLCIAENNDQKLIPRVPFIILECRQALPFRPSFRLCQ
jgi:hypothetical protein